MSDEYSNRIKVLRKQRRVSVAQLSQAVGLSSQYLYELERGEKRLNEDILRKLSDFFEVSVDYILGMSPEPTRLWDKVMDPDYLPNEYDLELLFKEANIRFQGERIAKTDKENILQMVRILWDVRRNVHNQKGR